MTNRDVFHAAIHLAGETAPSSCTDYSTRAASLLALIYDECAALDAAYREANEQEAGSWSYSVSISLDDAFPLCDIFSAPAAFGLAALLCISENADLSGSLYQRFSSMIQEIQNGLPAKPEPIVDAYHLI